MIFELEIILVRMNPKNNLFSFQTRLHFYPSSTPEQMSERTDQIDSIENNSFGIDERSDESEQISSLLEDTIPKQMKEIKEIQELVEKDEKIQETYDSLMENLDKSRIQLKTLLDQVPESLKGISEDFMGEINYMLGLYRIERDNLKDSFDYLKEAVSFFEHKFVSCYMRFLITIHQYI